MKQTQTMESKSYFWILAILLVLAGLFFYKSKKLKDKGTEYMVKETPIMDSNGLERESMQLDGTDVDAQLDAQLDLLQNDAAEMKQ